MRNQRGEVVTGVMVVMMCVMMLFGGMRMTHIEHGSEESRAQIEHKPSRPDESMQHMHDNGDQQAAVPQPVPADKK